MKKCPAIVVYKREDGESLNSNAEYLAFFLDVVKPHDKPARLEFLPLRFQAASSAMARQAAENWWRDEQQKEIDKEKRLEKRKTEREKKNGE